MKKFLIGALTASILLLQPVNASRFLRPFPALTAFGEALVGQLHPIFQGTFEYTVNNTMLNANFVTNGGTVTQASAMAIAGTSITTASTARLESATHARYRAGLGGLLRFTAKFTTCTTGTTQLIGLADEPGSSVAFRNGFLVGCLGNVFGFHRFSNDTVTTVAQTDWNKDVLGNTGGPNPSGQTLDITKLSVFFINFQYLGAGGVTLRWERGDTSEIIDVHTIHYSNANDEPISFQPNWHFTMFVDNGATTSDIIIKSASYAYFIEGKTKLIEIHQPQFSTGEKQKTSVTAETAIFTIRVKSTYASKSNFITILLELTTASIEAVGTNNLGKVRIVRNATLGGAPSYADINTTDSVVEIDVAGTTVTGGTEIITLPLAGKNDKTILPLMEYSFVLRDGETITFAGSSTNSATINASLIWKELF